MTATKKEQLWTPSGMREVAVGGDEKTLKDIVRATETWDPDPLQNMILLRPLPPEEMSKGGLHLPETARNKMILKGIVRCCGQGRRDAAGNLIPIGVKEGDVVLASTYSTNTEIELEGQRYHLLREEDILLRFRRRALPPPPPVDAAPPAVPAPVAT